MRTNMKACTPCPGGRYGDTLKRAFDCSRCPKGYYEEMKGVAACKKCPRGLYSSTLGATDCKVCGEGKYSDNLGNTDITDCKSCPLGWHGREEERDRDHMSGVVVKGGVLVADIANPI